MGDQEEQYYTLFISKKNFLKVERDASKPTSAADACWMVANRLLLNDSDQFALFSLKSSGEERRLEPSEILSEVEASWEDPDENAFYLHNVSINSEATAVPVLMPDGTLSIAYVDKDQPSSAVCEILSARLPQLKYSLYELHLAPGDKFLHRRIGSREAIAEVYESFPDQTTPLPCRSMLALAVRDQTFNIRTDTATTLRLRAKPFESCSEVIERIVRDRALAVKQYEIHEVSPIRGTHRKLNPYESLLDIAGTWKVDSGNFFEFRAPVSAAAVRILLWDGSFKAVPIGPEQTCKTVLKNLSEKVLTKKWWQIKLLLVTAIGDKRPIDWEEKPLALLQSDANAKLIAREINDATEPVEEEEPEIPDAVDPALLKYTDMYLRLRASSSKQKSVEISLSTSPEPKSSGSFQYVAAENVFSLHVDATTTKRDVMLHLTTIVMPSMAAEDFKLLVRGPSGKQSDFFLSKASTIRKQLSDDDSILGSLAVLESHVSEPSDIQLVLQFDPPMLDDVELDALEDEALKIEGQETEKYNSELEAEPIIVFFNKESFVQLTASPDVTVRWALNSVATILGVNAIDYALFETGGGQERLLDESSRLAAILRSWKLSSNTKTRALSFKRKATSVRDTIRMGLSTQKIDLSSIGMLPSTRDADADVDDDPALLATSKRKRKFHRIHGSSNDVSSDTLTAAKEKAKATTNATNELEAALLDVETEAAEQKAVPPTLTPPAEVANVVTPAQASEPSEASTERVNAAPAAEPAKATEAASQAQASSPAGTTAPTRPARPGPSATSTARRTKGDFGSLRDGRRAKNSLAGITISSQSAPKSVSALDAALDDLNRIEEEPTSEKLEDSLSESHDPEASLEESSESSMMSSSSSSALTRSSSSSNLLAKSPMWLVTETDVPTYGGIATSCLSHLLSFDVEKIHSSIAELAADTKKQLAQLKYFEEHGPLLSAALHSQLKAVLLKIREVPAGVTQVPEELQPGVAEESRALSGAVCAFLELISYATDASIEEQTTTRVQYMATLLAQVLQLLHAERYDDLPEVGTKIIAGAVRVSLLLRIRSHLSFTDDRIRILRRLGLQIKQSAYSLAGVVRTVAETQSLEDVDAIKQEVRSVATLLQQVPQIAKSEASSTSESANLLPEKSILMTRLYKAIKELLSALGQSSEHLPAMQSSLQAILEAIKKVNEGGMMPSIPKFLNGIVGFSVTTAAIASATIAASDKTQQDTREKAEAFENAITLERVQLLMLANMASGPADTEKLDLLLHYIGSILQLLADNIKKQQQQQQAPAKAETPAPAQPDTE